MPTLCHPNHCLAALLLTLASPAGALVSAPAPQAAETAAETAAATPGIADTQDAGADGRIAERIGAIFREIPALEQVGLEVDNGVVSLSGTVPTQEDVARAEAIASRVTGVVTVENALERDVSLAANTTALTTLPERFSEFVRFLPLLGVALLVALAIAAFGYLVAGLSAFWKRVMPNVFLADVVASAIRFIAIIGGIVVALDMIGAGALLGAVLGGAGVLGIALGFAMRDTIENYVASLVLSLRQPFRATDHVRIGEHEGRVVRLTSRATILMTLDGNHLRIPNGQVFKAVILNYSRNPQRRFEFELGVDAEDDPTAAREVGRRALAGMPFVLADPKPETRVVEMGESSIVLKFLAWIDQREADWFKARSRAITDVKAALEAAGFSLPEPIYRLRFDPQTFPPPVEVEAHGEPGRAAKSGSAGQRRPRNAPPSAEDQADTHDVSPRDGITEMVEAERRDDGAQRADLLDHSRPVE